MTVFCVVTPYLKIMSSEKTSRFVLYFVTWQRWERPFYWCIHLNACRKMKGMRSRKAGRKEGRAFIDSKNRALMIGIFFRCKCEQVVELLCITAVVGSPSYSLLLQQIITCWICCSVIILSQGSWKKSASFGVRISQINVVDHELLYHLSARSSWFRRAASISEHFSVGFRNGF